ncbi:diphosphomevalonate decarboxylase [Leuconostoc carnosum]|uniref:diphosphomevalonate decarboxylase n=2 Tax=Leuconostoc carnosum TaxID=1252 RepID=K0D7I8_LEUCJ|nr:diphosphomevalonate decarboxylase [Leuconostoc carnosum]AFT81894.1 diphosphomevalonate decarboxylase [Leuconostoc carnosum JB16]KAA8328473.1 diphosphomevalonate decarboxylase [Leuconostoc carnosum]KAA8371032.1 diphosphomevalonate decarboxylase [Leuconostoc carnosum]KAA8382674.1 diphosphomevalonate decarboxylase [Leuconostoc carnosum]QEA32631.1 diphosphomevalonate decarboxylase [Leuconostoc carnosum]
MTSTATAHTNIALIKYWGKKDAILNLPTTSSLSLTLDKFYTTTTVSKNDSIDTLILNGQNVDARKIQNFLNILRDELGTFDQLTITSENHVPTSAGLASSASAFAALTAAVTRELALDLPNETLSRLARRGSGSASRSFYGHFAVWHEGIDDKSSFAESIAAPDMPIALVVAEVSSETKKVSSTEGMQRAMTSPDYSSWIQNSAKQFLDIQNAIITSDIEKIGYIAEKNALDMHALNLTARQQPFTYFTQETQQILAIVSDLRHKGILAFSTMDAGPNVKIITTLNEAPTIVNHLKKEMPHLKVQTAASGPGVTYD